MTEGSRQIVRQHVDQAIEAAMPGLQARLDGLEPEARLLARERAQGIIACLRDLTDAPSAQPSIQEALTRLIFVHADPRVVAALREFTQDVNLCLQEVRSRVAMSGERRDS